MPTIISHGAVGLFAGSALSPATNRRAFWFFSLLCPVVPDADVIAFRLSIPYSHVLGHRGFSHSVAFAVLFSLLVVILFFRQKEKPQGRGTELAYLGYFTLLTSSHGILDAFTNGGLGVALLAPFSNERFFFWTTPIQVSAISPAAFFKTKSLAVLTSELAWVWLPLAASTILLRLGMWLHRRNRGS